MTIMAMKDSKKIKEFKKIVWGYYKEYGRAMPWRETTDPYHILVSEIMLQQTQVKRVLEKYPLFITTFPDFKSLARASFSDILKIWQGMGYNRRAITLKKIAVFLAVSFNFSTKIPVIKFTTDKTVQRKKKIIPKVSIVCCGLIASKIPTIP